MIEELIRIFTGREAFTTQARLKPSCGRSFQSCASMMCLRGSEVEMSSSNPVRGDPLPDWLQPFDENLVDEEEQRGDLWKCMRTCR